MKSGEQKNLIRKTPLFSGLMDEEIEAVSDIATQSTFRKNTVVIHEGDVTDSLFIIVKGNAEAVSIDPNGRQIVLNTFRDGDYFGEMSFLDGKPRSVSVITKAKTRVLMIPRKDFRNIIEHNPELVFRLMKGVVSKLRKATQMIEDLAFKDVYGRIVRLFFQESVKEGDRFVTREKLTHQEIANRIGSSREMVSRILKELESGNYISKHRGIYMIEKDLPVSW